MLQKKCSGWKFQHVGIGLMRFFYPDVCRETYNLVLLLINNAPGHFEAFKMVLQRCCMSFFPFNKTSWKQQCDFGGILAVKKRYNFLL